MEEYIVQRRDELVKVIVQSFSLYILMPLQYASVYTALQTVTVIQKLKG